MVSTYHPRRRKPREVTQVRHSRQCTFANRCNTSSTIQSEGCPGVCGNLGCRTSEQCLSPVRAPGGGGGRRVRGCREPRIRRRAACGPPPPPPATPLPDARPPPPAEQHTPYPTNAAPTQPHAKPHEDLRVGERARRARGLFSFRYICGQRRLVSRGVPRSRSRLRSRALQMQGPESCRVCYATTASARRKFSLREFSWSMAGATA